MARVRIILHGKAAGNTGVRAAVHKLRQDGHSVEVRITWGTGGCRPHMTEEAIAKTGGDKINCIVAGGGDGTINEVFGAASAVGLPEECCLGVLPLGTANDFAHSTGVPLQDLTAALQLAASGSPQRIDLGLLNGKPFVNLASGGFGSRVTVETDPELKATIGVDWPMCSPASRALRNWQQITAAFVRKVSHGRDASWPLRSAMAGRLEGGVPLCPDALIDDGLLDLMILPELDHAARLEAFSHLLREGAAAIHT